MNSEWYAVEVVKKKTAAAAAATGNRETPTFSIHQQYTHFFFYFCSYLVFNMDRGEEDFNQANALALQTSYLFHKQQQQQQHRKNTENPVF